VNYLEVKRSKVKVTRRINAHTVNVQYLPNGNTYEVQAWLHRRSRKTRISNERRELQGKRSGRVARSRDASDRCWPLSREQNVLETPKLVGRLSTPRTIMRTSFKVKDKGQGHQAYIMLRPELRYIFQTERPTNFKLGVLYRWRTKTRIAVMDHHQQGQRLRSRCYMVRLTAYKSRTKSPRNIKIV